MKPLTWDEVRVGMVVWPTKDSGWWCGEETTGNYPGKKNPVVIVKLDVNRKLIIVNDAPDSDFGPKSSNGSYFTNFKAPPNQFYRKANKPTVII